MEDLQLLREYAEQRSERAFTELVNRHIDFVYSTALRLVGESQLAEDVTQLVFIKLARKAGSLREGTVLTGWLYRTTQFVAQTAQRSDWRRRKRESLAMQFTELNGDSESVWKEVAPFLEQAVAQLRQSDQDAVLLRFFAGRSLREVGQALGISDGAAQKRVNRALEKMRDYFAAHGVVTSVAAIAPAIAAYAVQTAPGGLVSNLVTASTAAVGSAGAATTFQIFKAMAFAKLTSTTGIGIVAALLLTSAVLVVKMQSDANKVAVVASPPAAFVLRGTVRTPDGKPLAGALVRVATVGGLVRLYETNSLPTNIPARVSRISTNTATDGSFVVGLPTVPPEGKAVVVVTDDRFYAVAAADELSEHPDIVVQPWGRIEGVLRIGKTLASNQTVSISIWGSGATYEWTIVSHNTSVKTDANGRFVFARVAPGDVWLTHSVVIRPGEARPSGHHYVKVAPGDHVQVQLGGIGRVVVGRMEWNSTDKLNFYGTLWAKENHGMRTPRDWRDMSMEEQRKYVRQWRESTEGELFKQEVRNYEFPVQADGTFRVEDVLPGRYRMQVRADAPVPKGQSPRLAAVAEIQVNVPESLRNGSDESYDLGTVFPKPVPTR
jgi:RNA polymerase sigma factor (sigma-70 family)